jgi:CHAT domain-containing protein
VSDEGTLTLMSEFYRQMSRPEVTIKAEGLRQAQLSTYGSLIFGRGGEIWLKLNDEQSCKRKDRKSR